MALRNVALTVNFTVWDTSNNVGRTGDAANLTLRLIKDGGAAAAPSGSISEPDSTNLKGVYEIPLTATEMDADFIALGGISSTADTIIIPTYIHTESGALPNAAPGANGGLPTVDASNRLAGIQGTKNTLDDLNDLTAAAVNAEVDTALADVNLDHIVGTATAIPAIPAGTYIDQMMDDGTATYDRTTDSLQAIRDTAPLGTAMRGTDNAALASVLGALADAAAAGDPTATDTVMAYLKQIINALEGSVGIPTFPAATTPANNVSMAEILRQVYDEVAGLSGSAMRGTDDAALASVATEARLAELDAANLPSDIDAILVDTGTTLDARIPAALVSGRMSSDAVSISGSTDAADKLEASAETIVIGAAIAGTLSTTQMTTDLTEATDDHYNGRVLIWTSGVLIGQATDITDYTGATKLLTFTAVTEAPSATDTFVIV